MFVINDVECRIFPKKCSRNEKYLGVAEFAHIILHLGLEVIQNPKIFPKTSQNNPLQPPKGLAEKLGALFQKFFFVNKS